MSALYQMALKNPQKMLDPDYDNLNKINNESVLLDRDEGPWLLVAGL
jgi:hypothetical protein